jgi:hypothetical protein
MPEMRIAKRKKYIQCKIDRWVIWFVCALICKCENSVGERNGVEIHFGYRKVKLRFKTGKISVTPIEKGSLGKSVG